jgi:hypothetical protein
MKYNPFSRVTFCDTNILFPCVLPFLLSTVEMLDTERAHGKVNREISKVLPALLQIGENSPFSSCSYGLSAL